VLDLADNVMDIVIPEGSDYVAMGVAFLAYFVLSFLWWGPLFGKTWSRLMGFDMDERPSMVKPLLLQALGTALMAFIFWNVFNAFAATTNDAGDLVMGDLSIGNGLLGALFTWMGFFVPVQLGRVAWERAPWALFGINAAGHLVGLSAMGVVYALM
jgi:hypothetical protein